VSPRRVREGRADGWYRLPWQAVGIVSGRLKSSGGLSLPWATGSSPGGSSARRAPLAAGLTCPVSTEGWTRRVQLVREGGGRRGPLAAGLARARTVPAPSARVLGRSSPDTRGGARPPGPGPERARCCPRRRRPRRRRRPEPEPDTPPLCLSAKPSGGGAAGAPRMGASGVGGRRGVRGRGECGDDPAPLSAPQVPAFCAASARFLRRKCPRRRRSRISGGGPRRHVQARRAAATDAQMRSKLFVT
jgi:hypothetical protein